MITCAALLHYTWRSNISLRPEFVVQRDSRRVSKDLLAGFYSLLCHHLAYPVCTVEGVEQDKQIANGLLLYQ
jgi:hypothetical protein